MTESTRTPSPLTLQKRAYGRVVSLKAKLAALTQRNNKRKAKFEGDERQLNDHISAAQAELDQFTGEKPERTTDA